jgi:hypothetical protein
MTLEPQPLHWFMFLALLIVAVINLWIRED